MYRSLCFQVKFRIAEGLRMEGWNITKHLLMELIILTIGFVTCVPAIQVATHSVLLMESLLRLEQFSSTSI